MGSLAVGVPLVLAGTQRGKARCQWKKTVLTSQVRRQPAASAERSPHRSSMQIPPHVLRNGCRLMSPRLPSWAKPRPNTTRPPGISSGPVALGRRSADPRLRLLAPHSIKSCHQLSPRSDISLRRHGSRTFALAFSATSRVIECRPGRLFRSWRCSVSPTVWRPRRSSPSMGLKASFGNPSRSSAAECAPEEGVSAAGCARPERRGACRARWLPSKD